MNGLSLDIASAAERPVLENLVQLYIHDFSELFAGTSRGDLSDDGRYSVDIPLANWWQMPGHIPLLFRFHGRLAGFALLNTATHSGAPTDRNMAEFFVVRKYRRSGLGTAAAQTLFTRYPGRWEAAVMRTNSSAHAFWHRAIATHPAVARIAIAENGHAGRDGAIFRFDIARS